MVTALSPLLVEKRIVPGWKIDPLGVKCTTLMLLALVKVTDFGIGLAYIGRLKLYITS